MFDWFKGKSAKEQSDASKEASNVVKFPEPKHPPMPTLDPPKVYYRFGITDNNRVAFQMGYSEITMNRTGCQNLIDQLTFFMDQLDDESNET